MRIIDLMAGCLNFTYMRFAGHLKNLPDANGEPQCSIVADSVRVFFDPIKGIQLRSLACLVDSNAATALSRPDGGRVKLVSGAQFVQVISSEAPLGYTACEADKRGKQ